jgi:hypothetical protein
MPPNSPLNAPGCPGIKQNIKYDLICRAIDDGVRLYLSRGPLPAQPWTPANVHVR